MENGIIISISRISRSLNTGIASDKQIILTDLHLLTYRQNDLFSKINFQIDGVPSE